LILVRCPQPPPDLKCRLTVIPQGGLMCCFRFRVSYLPFYIPSHHLRWRRSTHPSFLYATVTPSPVLPASGTWTRLLHGDGVGVRDVRARCARCSACRGAVRPVGLHIELQTRCSRSRMVRFSSTLLRIPLPAPCLMAPPPPPPPPPAAFFSMLADSHDCERRHCS
jgi:hypothetical protein